MHNFSSEDHAWMDLALKWARRAAEIDEVPVGAVLVGPEGQLLSQGYNLRESLTSPLGHAELLVIHRASQKMKTWRLQGATLYVTLEPCVMCAGALVQSRIQRLVYGAPDPKGGGIHSLYQVAQDQRLNHQFFAEGGLKANESRELLQKFFRQKRKAKKSLLL